MGPGKGAQRLKRPVHCWIHQRCSIDSIRPDGSSSDPLSKDIPFLIVQPRSIGRHPVIGIGTADSLPKGTSVRIDGHNTRPFALTTSESGLLDIEPQARFLLALAMACITVRFQNRTDIRDEVGCVGWLLSSTADRWCEERIQECKERRDMIQREIAEHREVSLAERDGDCARHASLHQPIMITSCAAENESRAAEVRQEPSDPGREQPRRSLA